MSTGLWKKAPRDAANRSAAFPHSLTSDQGEPGCSTRTHQEKPYNCRQLFWTTHKITTSHCGEMVWMFPMKQWDKQMRLYLDPRRGKQEQPGYTAFPRIDRAIQAKSLQPLGKHSKGKVLSEQGLKSKPHGTEQREHLWEELKGVHRWIFSKGTETFSALMWSSRALFLEEWELSLRSSSFDLCQELVTFCIPLRF